MARGRPSTPAQSKVIQGNFRKDRHDHGPKVELGLPPCPKWLPKAARVHWATLGAELAKVGLLSIIDGDIFALHCDSMAKFEEVTKKLKSIEECFDATPQGFHVQSVLFTIRSKLHEQITKTGREFGLSPAGRSSLKVEGPKQQSFDGWGDV